MTEVKLCKECRFIRHYTGGYFCECPELTVFNLVTGSQKGIPALELRETGKCGRDAKYWEPFKD
jgi:hypothetical protein